MTEINFEEMAGAGPASRPEGVPYNERLTEEIETGKPTKAGSNPELKATPVHEPPAQQAPLPALSPLEEMKALLAQYDAPLAEMAAQAQALEVTDEESQVQATGMAAQAKKLAKALDGDRKGLTEPLTKMSKAIKALADNYLDKLGGIERGLTGKIGTFLRAQELARREAEKAAREAQVKAQAEIDARAKAAGVEPVVLEQPVVPAQETKTRTEAGTSYVKSVWKFEVEDAAQVPRQFLVVSDQLIRQAVQAGAREIPGVRIYEEQTVQIRTN